MDDNWEYPSRKRPRSSTDENKDTSDDNLVTKKPWLANLDSSKNIYAKGNHIYYYAGVSKESVYKLNEHLVRLNQEFVDLERKHPQVEMKSKPIYLHINSYGGSVFAAFAAIDFITQSKIPVYTIVEGATASAGTLMSVVGEKRFMRPHASMLIHQLSSWLGGKMTEIEDSFQNLEQMMDTIKSIYIKHTRLAGKELDDFLKHDLWWKVDKCISVGLIDEIWQ